MMPIGKAMTMEKSMPSVPSSRLSTSRFFRSDVTGRRVRNESPRSPRTIPPTHSTYCRGMERLSWKRSSRAARASGSGERM